MLFSGLEFVDTFAADYDVAVARERPSNSSREFHFALPGHRVQDGLLLRVTPASGIFATPDPHVLFVVSYGNGYLVDVRDPESYAPTSHWITAVEPVPDAKTLGFVDPWSVYGIRSNGLAWEQDSLHVDGFSNIRIDGQFFEATAYCGANGDVEVRVDAHTGELVRGHEGAVQYGARGRKEEADK